MKKGKILIILVIAALMLLAACNSKPASGSKVSPDWDSEKLGINSPFDNREEFESADGSYGVSNENGKMLISSPEIFYYGTLEEILERNTPHLIVKGTVLGFDFGDDGDEYTIYTMYHVEPTEILRGEAKTDESGLINIMAAGGQNDNTMYVAEMIPPLSVGSEYIFLLNDPISWGDGVDTNNAGYYAFTTGGGLACCTVNDSGDDATVTPLGSVIGVAIQYGKFKDMVKGANAAVPVQTESEMRKEYVDRWRYTIDTYVSDGRMTQEEYDEAKDWLDAYEFYTGE